MVVIIGLVSCWLTRFVKKGEYGCYVVVFRFYRVDTYSFLNVISLGYAYFLTGGFIFNFFVLFRGVGVGYMVL